jgi:cellulose synthase/poly-beta-1,6-N-acetylglucosamine synthase-like glycosyltransferase
MEYLALALLVPATIACSYHLALTLLGRRPRRAPAIPAGHRITVLVPAHNEETGVAATIQSVLSANFPRDLVRVLVVADNCSDGTAGAARAAGADVEERDDPARRGKGYALALGLPCALADRPDAVLVLDADCELAPGSLPALDAALAAGAAVVQGSVRVRNPDAGPACLVSAVGAALDNAAGAAKGRLGLRVPLRGTGMAFRREVLDRFPWEAFGLTEDAEYAARLAAGGVRVVCEPRLEVRTDAPTATADLCGQRRRWRASLFVGRGGLPARWLNSKPLVLAQLTAAVAVAEVTGNPAVVAWAGGLLAGTVVYFGIAVTEVGLTARRAGVLLVVPTVVARLLIVTVGGLFRRGSAWQRTRRTAELARPAP